MQSVKRTGGETKTKALCELLRELAYERGPGAKLPTAVELCAMFSTSRTTLNDALGILEAQNVLYRRRGSGIYVSAKLHTRCIAVLLYADCFLGKGLSPFWGILSGLIVQEIERRRYTSGSSEHIEFHYVLSMPGETIKLPASIMAMVRAEQLHGILAVGMDYKTYNWLQEQNVPCVVYAGYSKHAIVLDFDDQYRLAIPMMAELGSCRPGLWTTCAEYQKSSGSPSEHSKLPLFTDLLAEHGLPFYPHLVRYELFSSFDYINKTVLSYQEQGYRHAMAVFGDSTQERPDVLFITDDMVTFGAMVAFHKLGIRPGVDVKIISHANEGSPTLFGYETDICLIQYDPMEIVRSMFSLLDTLMMEPDTGMLHINIQPRVLRNSW